MSRHVSARTLAEFRAGILRRRRAARIRAHLGGCARCSRTDAELTEVTSLLVSTQVPAMPADLTARIEAALAAEGTRRSASPAGQAVTGPPHRSGGARGAVRARPGWRRPPLLASPVAVRVLAAAAVLVVIASGGYGILQVLQGGQQAATSSAGPLHRQARAPSLRSGTAAGSYAGATRSGTDYQPGTLARQVSAVLASRQTYAGSPSVPSPARSGVSMGPAESSLRCPLRVPAGQRLLLVDAARYRGRPATIVVTAIPGGADQVRVIGPGCTVIARATLPPGG